MLEGVDEQGIPHVHLCAEMGVHDERNPCGKAEAAVGYGCVIVGL